MNDLNKAPAPIDLAAVFSRLSESSQYEQSLMRGFGMCWALTFARRADLISKEEETAGYSAIECYLDQFAQHNDNNYAPFLRDALRLAGLPWQAWHMIAIYADWNNRPMPWSNGQ